MKLLFGIILYMYREAKMRIKWLRQDIDARILGYRSHAEFMQYLLNVSAFLKEDYTEIEVTDEL